MKSARRRAGERRQEVEWRLAAAGFAKRSPQALRVEVNEPRSLRLRETLIDLGPVFSAFGRYLSSRLDLLPEGECQVLATVPDRRAPMAPEAVREVLREELGRHPEEAYAAFEIAPLISTLVYQDHQARLAGGEAVIVRLVRPELAAELDRDLDLLPLISPALAAGKEGGAWIGSAVDDFALAMVAEADLARQAAAFELLRQDGAASGLAFSAPRIVPSLSGLRVLTCEALPGAPLEDFFPLDSSAEGWRAAGGPAPGGIAVRLCQACLRQAFFGQAFPVELKAGEVRILPADRIVWTGGTFAALPAAAKETLWEYLLAAAAQDPERACAALTREMDGGPAGGEGLYQRLRQLVPFRDGGWAATDDLAGYLFLHWCCAAALGYRPRPHLILFYRGLAKLAVVARRLAPGRDSLRAGLEGARLAAGLGEVTQLFESDQVKVILGSYAAAMLAMPHRLNELLTLAAEGRASIKLEMVEQPAERRRKDLSSVALAALLAMAAVALLAHYLTPALGPWVDRIAAVLLAALGVFLLRGLARG